MLNLGCTSNFSIIVKAKVELKSSILIDAISEINTKSFILGVKVGKENKFLKNLSLYGPFLAHSQKKDTYQLDREVNLQLFGAIVNKHPSCYLQLFFKKSEIF
jgi:hypothetical protein